MTAETLSRLIEQDSENINQLHPLLRALCLLKQDRWDEAHLIADDFGGPHGDWLHAYLHRFEGDTWNADYWYRRAGRKRPDTSLNEEWKDLAKNFIQNYS